MSNLIQIQLGEFRGTGVFDANNVEVKRGDLVIVEADRGIEFGQIVSIELSKSSREKGLSGKVLRKVTDADRKQLDNNRTKAREALNVCISKVTEMKLDMHVLRAEYAFDATKIVFYFISEGRIDFRDLVKELARMFRMRIELKQIGVRDRAKMMGGYGVCGESLCCSSFMKDFQQLSIKMAKEQALPLNPSKISGVCGRIKCCMAYEFEVYRELNRGLPKMGAKIQIAEGKGKVVNLDILKRMMTVDIGEGKFIKKEVPLGGNYEKK